MRLLLLAALLPLAACAGSPPPASPRPVFDPLAFFSGRTEGRARLAIAFRAPRGVHVIGSGRVEPDGALVLDQRVEQQGEPPKDRQWRIRRVGPNRYAGTLTDASGPVAGEVEGNRLHLAFPMKGGLRAEQWLLLASDGRSADNRMTVSKFGVVVARLRETITKG